MYKKEFCSKNHCFCAVIIKDQAFAPEKSTDEKRFATRLPKINLHYKCLKEAIFSENTKKSSL